MESKQKLQQQPLEDPASLFPWCSWCGEEDHRWRACPEGLPADWCGRCEEYGHNWAGCPYAPAQASAACPLLSEEPAACPLLSEEPAACPLLSEEPAAFPLLSEEPATKKGGGGEGVASTTAPTTTPASQSGVTMGGPLSWQCGNRAGMCRPPSA
ncbi:UNVERIFIED_CONTAM: hypothetical protein FKN15_042370 [Acipenser sinensis]